MHSEGKVIILRLKTRNTTAYHQNYSNCSLLQSERFHSATQIPSILDSEIFKDLYFNTMSYLQK